MLREHPHIQRARIMETLTERGIMQRLVVETNINLTEKRTETDKQKLSKLKAFLNNIATNDFGDFREIEIRPYEEETDFVEAGLVA